MLTNGCATLYNRWEEEDAEQCIRTVLPAVFWQGEAQGGFTGRRYSKKGKEARYNALILVPGDRLPADRSYLPPRQWLALPKEEKKLLNDYRSLTENEKKEIRDFLDFLKSKQ